MDVITQLKLDVIDKRLEALEAVCLDQSVVMPQDAAEQGSREASEPNAVRDVMAAVDGIKSLILRTACDLGRGNNGFQATYSRYLELISILQQLSIVAEKLNKAAK